MHAAAHTQAETLRDGSKKTPSHRNLRGREGGRDRESERSGKRGIGRGERVRERRREFERERKLVYMAKQEMNTNRTEINCDYDLYSPYVT